MRLGNLRNLVFSRLAKSVSYVLAANVFSQVISFAFLVLVTKNLSIADYGIYAVFTMIASTATDLSDMGMNASVTRFSARYNATGEFDLENKLISFAFKRKLRNAVVVNLVVFALSGYISVFFFKTTEFGSLIQLLSVSVLFSLLAGLNDAILQGRQEYKKYLTVKFLSGLIYLCLLGVLVFLNKISLFMLVLVTLANSFVYYILSYSLIKYNVLWLKDPPNQIRKDFTGFGRWMVLWSIFAILQSKVDIFMLAKLTTVEQVSYYDIAFKLARPILLVLSAYGQVLNPLLSSCEDRSRIKGYVRKNKKIVTSFTAILIIGVFSARYLIWMLFGNKFSNSVLPLEIILISLCFFVWELPYNTALYALNKPHVFSIGSLAGLVCTVVGNMLLLPSFGAVGASLTYLGAQVVGLSVALIGYRIYMGKENLIDE